MSTPPNMSELLKVAQEMQSSMKTAHDELQKAEYTGEAGGGIVKVTMNGRYYAKKVSIANEAYQQGTEILEDLIAAAINATVSKIEDATQAKMAQLSKNLGVPMDKFKPNEDN